jgi:hypothetical protein
MITISSVCAIVPGLTEADLRLWLEQDFVRPERRGGELSFREIDVARVRLIRETSKSRRRPFPWCFPCLTSSTPLAASFASCWTRLTTPRGKASPIPCHR